MRYFKYYTLITFFLLTYIQSNAQTKFYGKIYKFEILPEYLVDGKIKINNEAYTEIKYRVGFAREFKTITPPTWMPFNITVRLSTANENGDIILFNSPYNITLAKFKKDEVFLDTVLTGIIDNSKVNKSRSVILSYIRDNQSFPNMGFEGKSYFIEKDDSPIIPNPPDPIFDIDSTLFYSEMIGKDLGYHLTEVQTIEKRQSPIFYAYKKRVIDSKLVFGYREPNNKGISYSYVRYGAQRPSDLHGAFYAFDHQVQGTVPIYEYSDVSTKTIFKYSPKAEEGDNFGSRKIAFYAFPYSRSTIIEQPIRYGRPRHRDFSIDPNQWVLNFDGTGYFFDLENVVPNSEIDNLIRLMINGDIVPPVREGQRGPSRESFILPNSFKGHNFTFEISKNKILILSTNALGTAPANKIDFSVTYAPGP